MRELFNELWATARRNKLRTSLTGFAVAWGIFMLIFLLGAGNGLINAQLEQQGLRLQNSVMVFGGQTSKPYKGLKEGRSIRLNDRDVAITSKNFPGNTSDVGAILYQNNVNISYGQNYVASQLLAGVYPTNAKIEKKQLVAGRYINDIDMKQQRKVMILTETQAKELATDILSLVGRNVKVGDLAFKIVGIEQDNKQRQNNTAVVPYTTLKTIYAKGDNAGDIEFAINNLETEQANEDFAKSYRTSINSNHDAAPDDESTIFIWNKFLDNIQMSKGIALLRMALWIIGIFTLLSGVVGVSNIMLITVKERTREFGIRKALGAKPRQILNLIIVESVITTAFFGYIGMLCGIAANEYMNATIGYEVVNTGLFQATMFVDPTVGLTTCLQATMVIIIAGTIAGLIPALKAAKVRPIEALRGE